MRTLSNQESPSRRFGVMLAILFLASLGTVDRVVGERIKLTRPDSGSHGDHHHYISVGLVAEVEGDKVRLTARGDVVADLFEQEESGDPIG